MERRRYRSEQHRPQNDCDRLNAIFEVACAPQPGEQDQPPATTRGRADPQLLDESKRRVSVGRIEVATAAVTATISAIPAGSLNPDSPSRTVRARSEPLRPRKTA